MYRLLIGGITAPKLILTALTSKKYTAKQLIEDFNYNLDLCSYPHEEEEILDPMDLIQRYQEERASLTPKLTVYWQTLPKFCGVKTNDAAGT